MAISIVYAPTAPVEGDSVSIVATVSPTPDPTDNPYVEFVVSGVLDQNIPVSGDQAGVVVTPPEGAYQVDATYFLLGQPDSTAPTVFFSVAAPPTPTPQPPPAPPPAQAGAGSDSDPQTQGQPPEAVLNGPVASDATSAASSSTDVDPFTGRANADPFTGQPAADPFTGAPLTETDVAIMGRIADVYAQPTVDFSGVPQSVQDAIYGLYDQTAGDQAAVPQSVQDAIYAAYETGSDESNNLADDSDSGWLTGDDPISKEFRFQLNSGFDRLKNGPGIFERLEAAYEDVKQLVGQTVADVANRVGGGLQVAGGVVEVIGGTAGGILTSETGAGAALGGLVAGRGLDDINTGIDHLLGGTRKRPLTRLQRRVPLRWAPIKVKLSNSHGSSTSRVASAPARTAGPGSAREWQRWKAK